MFFFKQKTAYEMRISDWSSDVCSSDLPQRQRQQIAAPTADERPRNRLRGHHRRPREPFYHHLAAVRSEEHTSELQSLMRISYAVFCLTKKQISYHIQQSTPPPTHYSTIHNYSHVLSSIKTTQQHSILH